MNSSQAVVLYNNAQQSGSIGTYGSIQVNSYVLEDAQNSANLGVVLSTSSSCAVYMTGSSAPELTIDYTPGMTYEIDDINMDGNINVTDVVLTVNIILGMYPYTDMADLNMDNAINVQDVILLVNMILGNRGIDATSASIIDDGNSVMLSADGVIGGIQMTLNHGGDFSIELTDMSLFSNYRTIGNQTTLVIAAPGSDELFTYSGDMEIVEILVGNSQNLIQVTPQEYEMNISAYPNPFNPQVNISFSIPEDGMIAVGIYDLKGHQISELTNNWYEKGKHQLQWDAADFSSGVYFARLNSKGGSKSMMLLLLK